MNNMFFSFQDPLVPEIARLYKQDREAYNTVRRKMNSLKRKFRIYLSFRVLDNGHKNMLCDVYVFLCHIYYSEVH